MPEHITLPTIGGGATTCLNGDYDPYTVIAVSPSGSKVTLLADRVIVTEPAPYYGADPKYICQYDDAGHIVIARRGKNGRYHVQGCKFWGVVFGVRTSRCNPHV